MPANIFCYLFIVIAANRWSHRISPLQAFRISGKNLSVFRCSELQNHSV